MTLVRGVPPTVEFTPSRPAARHYRRATPAWRFGDPLTWWCAGWGALLGLALFALSRDAMPDDALIHAAYAQNLIERGEWALTPGVPANTATSPLWVWLLAAVGLMCGSVIAAGAALLVGCLAALAVALRRLAGARPPRSGRRWSRRRR